MHKTCTEYRFKLWYIYKNIIYLYKYIIQNIILNYINNVKYNTKSKFILAAIVIRDSYN